MPAPGPPTYCVVVLLHAPDLTPADTARELLAVLTPAAEPVPWAALAVSHGGPRTIRLGVTVAAPDGAGAATAVVDRLRGLLGLHPGFSRWVVDARHAQVERLPR